MGAETPLVDMTGISKRYGGVRACDDVDFRLYAGEVHALLGENGAGKTTLMRVLSGDVTDYTGSVLVAGSPVTFARPADAQKAGIAMIHQELDLVPGLSVSANLFLGREARTWLGAVDNRRMDRETRDLLGRTGIDLDPRRAVDELRTGEQQLVTIARALSLDARILIMDEPTSALSTAEVDRLFGVIAELRRSGVGVVYISHRMDEIGRIADRATVLRNGKVVREFEARAMTAGAAAEAMVGRPVRAMFRTETTETTDSGSGPTADSGATRVDPAIDPADGDGRGAAGTAGNGAADPGELLRLKDFVVQPHRERPGRRDPAGISLTVRRGEIVGLAGLLGAGRTELLEALFGAGTLAGWGGTVSFRGRAWRPSGPRFALRKGMAFVPEDRRVAGLALGHSVLANTVLSIVDKLARFGVLAGKTEQRAAAGSVDRLRIKLGALGDPVSSLSGGNQQKVVFGRMLLTRPDLLLLDEPTRGVDVGAKAEIYQLLGEVARLGIGVLLASSELAELLGVCDRVVVLSDGRSVREFSTHDTGDADLLAAVMGEGRATARAVLGTNGGNGGATGGTEIVGPQSTSSSDGSPGASSGEAGGAR